MLQKVLNLPSESTLRQEMRKVQIYRGFNENILLALQKKISSNPLVGNVCAVAFDEMAIKTELSYRAEEDNVEGLEDNGNERSATAAGHALVSMVTVLSHSVTAGINALVSLDKLPEEARKTAEFLERVDQLSNAFNSYSRRSN
ncbi:transposable element p transposase [Plakobranchus ocellatus]|uniref:Transposable element p transposase n=1 Tax=Plakobranchus ocellatus TaxID=259542 RepID=A0AAV3YHU3_9GAST|nr:transposable element p transposase [Plakobranchus ocellatus]